MDYREVFGHGAGQRVLYDLIARHFVLGSTFSPEPTIMAHQEGQRQVVLEILRYMQMHPADVAPTREGMIAQFEFGEDDDASRR